MNSNEIREVKDIFETIGEEIILDIESRLDKKFSGIEDKIDGLEEYVKELVDILKVIVKK